MPSSRHAWLIRGGCLAAACTLLICQEPPVLRVTTRLVEVNVIVTGKQGRSVEGLTKDDFAVIENGKPQPIAGFSAERLRVLPAPALEAIAGRVAALPGRKNLVWVTGGIPFSLGLGPRPMQDPARRTKRAQIPSGMDRRKNPLDAGDDDMFIEYPGAQKRIFDAENERVARAMDSADMAVYPVEAQGLAGNPAVDAPNRKSLEFEQRRKATATSLPEEFYSNRETMQSIAGRTGGIAFLDENETGRAIAAAVEDSRVNYVLTYHPSQSRWDGRFQRIKVSASRPGVSVRHRGGYLALPEEARVESNRQTALLEDARSPLESTAIRLVVATRPDTPSGGRLDLRVIIEAKDITFARKDRSWAGRIDLAYVQQPTPDGKGATLIKDNVELNLTRENCARIVEEGLIIPKQLSMASSAYRLKVVVRDANSGAVGSVEIPGRIPGR